MVINFVHNRSKRSIHVNTEKTTTIDLRSWSAGELRKWRPVNRSVSNEGLSEDGCIRHIELNEDKIRIVAYKHRNNDKRTSRSMIASIAIHIPRKKTTPTKTKKWSDGQTKLLHEVTHRIRRSVGHFQQLIDVRKGRASSATGSHFLQDGAKVVHFGLKLENLGTSFILQLRMTRLRFGLEECRKDGKIWMSEKAMIV